MTKPHPHPLTDKVIHDIVEDVSKTDWNDCEECEDSLLARAAYDLAIEHVYKIWSRLFEGEENDKTVSWVFNQELETLRSTTTGGQQMTKKAITIGEALDLVKFRYNYISERWEVDRVEGNSAMDVIGDCYRVTGIVCYTIGGREWQFIETPQQKLERLIEETNNPELIELYIQLEGQK